MNYSDIPKHIAKKYAKAIEKVKEAGAQPTNTKTRTKFIQSLTDLGEVLQELETCVNLTNNTIDVDYLLLLVEDLFKTSDDQILVHIAMRILASTTSISLQHYKRDSYVDRIMQIILSQPVRSSAHAHACALLADTVLPVIMSSGNDDSRFSATSNIISLVLNRLPGCHFEDYMKRLVDCVLPLTADIHLTLIETIAYSLPRLRRRATEMLFCYYPPQSGFINERGASLRYAWNGTPEAKDLLMAIRVLLDEDDVELNRCGLCLLYHLCQPTMEPEAKDLALLSEFLVLAFYLLRKQDLDVDALSTSPSAQYLVLPTRDIKQSYLLPWLERFHEHHFDVFCQVLLPIPPQQHMQVGKLWTMSTPSVQFLEEDISTGYCDSCSNAARSSQQPRDLYHKYNRHIQMEEVREPNIKEYYRRYEHILDCVLELGRTTKSTLVEEEGEQRIARLSLNDDTDELDSQQHQQKLYLPQQHSQQGQGQLQQKQGGTIIFGKALDIVFPYWIEEVSQLAYYNEHLLKPVSASDMPLSAFDFGDVSVALPIEISTRLLSLFQLVKRYHDTIAEEEEKKRFEEDERARLRRSNKFNYSRGDPAQHTTKHEAFRFVLSHLEASTKSQKLIFERYFGNEDKQSLAELDTHLQNSKKLLVWLSTMTNVGIEIPIDLLHQVFSQPQTVPQANILLEIFQAHVLRRFSILYTKKRQQQQQAPSDDASDMEVQELRALCNIFTEAFSNLFGKRMHADRISHFERFFQLYCQLAKLLIVDARQYYSVDENVFLNYQSQVVGRLLRLINEPATDAIAASAIECMCYILCSSADLLDARTATELANGGPTQQGLMDTNAQQPQQARGIKQAAYISLLEELEPLIIRSLWTMLDSRWDSVSHYILNLIFLFIRRHDVNSVGSEIASAVHNSTTMLLHSLFLQSFQSEDWSERCAGVEKSIYFIQKVSILFYNEQKTQLESKPAMLLEEDRLRPTVYLLFSYLLLCTIDHEESVRLKATLGLKSLNKVHVYKVVEAVHFMFARPHSTLKDKCQICMDMINYHRNFNPNQGLDWSTIIDELVMLTSQVSRNSTSHDTHIQPQVQDDNYLQERQQQQQQQQSDQQPEDDKQAHQRQQLKILCVALSIEMLISLVPPPPQQSHSIFVLIKQLLSPSYAHDQSATVGTDEAHVKQAVYSILIDKLPTVLGNKAFSLDTIRVILDIILESGNDLVPWGQVLSTVIENYDICDNTVIHQMLAIVDQILVSLVQPHAMIPLDTPMRSLLPLRVLSPSVDSHADQYNQHQLAKLDFCLKIATAPTSARLSHNILLKELKIIMRLYLNSRVSRFKSIEAKSLELLRTLFSKYASTTDLFVILFKMDIPRNMELTEEEFFSVLRSIVDSAPDRNTNPEALFTPVYDILVRLSAKDFAASPHDLSNIITNLSKYIRLACGLSNPVPASLFKQFAVLYKDITKASVPPLAEAMLHLSVTLMETNTNDFKALYSKQAQKLFGTVVEKSTMHATAVVQPFLVTFARLYPKERDPLTKSVATAFNLMLREKTKVSDDILLSYIQMCLSDIDAVISQVTTAKESPRPAPITATTTTTTTQPNGESYHAPGISAFSNNNNNNATVQLSSLGSRRRMNLSIASVDSDANSAFGGASNSNVSGNNDEDGQLALDDHSNRDDRSFICEQAQIFFSALVDFVGKRKTPIRTTQPRSQSNNYNNNNNNEASSTAVEPLLEEQWQLELLAVEYIMKQCDLVPKLWSQLLAATTATASNSGSSSSTESTAANVSQGPTTTANATAAAGGSFLLGAIDKLAIDRTDMNSMMKVTGLVLLELLTDFTTFNSNGNGNGNRTSNSNSNTSSSNDLPHTLLVMDWFPESIFERIADSILLLLKQPPEWWNDSSKNRDAVEGIYMAFLVCKMCFLLLRFNRAPVRTELLCWNEIWTPLDALLSQALEAVDPARTRQRPFVLFAVLDLIEFMQRLQNIITVYFQPVWLSCIMPRIRQYCHENQIHAGVATTLLAQIDRIEENARRSSYSASLMLPRRTAHLHADDDHEQKNRITRTAAAAANSNAHITLVRELRAQVLQYRQQARVAFQYWA